MTQTSLSRTFGAFSDTNSESDEYLTLHFSPSSAPRKRRWSNYGLSADFLGDYFAAFFPGDEIPDSKINRREAVKAAVSYIANELLENAVKYNEDSANLPITISLHLYEQEIVFQVINHISELAAEKYQNFIQEILTSDIDELYMRQLERAAVDGSTSGMGLLTMINDYSARFGWKFEVVKKMPGVVQVGVVVHLDV